MNDFQDICSKATGTAAPTSASSTIGSTSGSQSSTSTSGSVPSRTSSSAPENSGGNNNSSVSGGLSTGAKAGIGVGVGIAAILLIIAAFLYGRRRQPKATPAGEPDSSQDPDPPKEDGVPELGGRIVPELAGKKIVPELSGQAVAELDSERRRGPAEVDPHGHSVTNAPTYWTAAGNNGVAEDPNSRGTWELEANSPGSQGVKSFGSPQISQPTAPTHPYQTPT